MDMKEKEQLREKLIERRREIFDRRQKTRQDWGELHDREIELEEQAGKEYLAAELYRLEDRDVAEIEGIDRALHLLETDSYGFCESCGEPIAAKRLQAVPWAFLCLACLQERERRPVSLPAEEIIEREPPAPPEDLAGLTDEELGEVIRERLDNDGRVVLDELEIHVRNGMVHLEGFLPSKAANHIMMQIVQDDLGLRTAVNRVKIDQTLWEGTERAPEERRVE